MTTILNSFMGYQDFLNPDQLIQLNNNSQSFGNKQFIFLLSKNTLSLFLPNNGKVFGYSLFNNSMNFIYNHTLKEEDSIPLKINHDLVYNNGNIVINRSLIYDNSKNIINNVKFLKSYLFGSKEQINNDIVLGEQRVIIPEDPHTQEGDVQKKKLEDLNTASSSSDSSNSHFTNNQEEAKVENNVIPSPTDTTIIDSSSESPIVEDKNKVVTNNNEKIQAAVDIKDDVENDLIIDSRPPQTQIPTLNSSPSTDTSTSSSSESSSSSSSSNTTSSSSNDYSNIIDNEEKIINFNNTLIKVQNNIITEVNGKKIKIPIITDEKLKFYFETGRSKNKIKNTFLSYFYTNLHEKDDYKIYTSSFFLLRENFKEEFKILITFFNHEKFILDKKILDWFIQNKIQNEILLIADIINNSKIPNKTNIFSKYYNYRIKEVNSDSKEDLSIFYEIIDKYELLKLLKTMFEFASKKNE